MNLPEVTPVAVGASSVIARVCQDLGIVRTINAICEWDETQCKVTPGSLIVALVINMLVERRPLYRISRFYERMDVPTLFNESVTADDFNDDALGRALDRLFLAGGKRVFESIACGAVSRGDIPVDVVHADTTSISVYGEFKPSEKDEEVICSNPEIELLNISHGHSKDHRPDLKQFLYGLVTNAEGIPLIGTVNDGNMSDKPWNLEVIDEMQRSFIEPWKVIYVADSSLVTPDNLGRMAKQKVNFISRLPETYNLAKELKQEAWKVDKWIEHGPLVEGKKAAHYKTQSFVKPFQGRDYRFTVVHSSSLDKRKTNAVQRRIAKEKASLEKHAKDLMKQAFNCEADAAKALEQFQNEHRGSLHHFEGQVNMKETPIRPPGRPRKNAVYPTETTFYIAGEILPPGEAAVKRLQEQESAFVLITTLEEKRYSNHEVLEEYKNQSTVENRFRFLKHPMMVDGIYVQSPRRAEALAYVFLIALLVASFLEMKIRRELKATNEEVELEGKRKTKRPTILAILEHLNTIQIVKVETDTGVMRILPKNIDPTAKRFVELAGYDASIYTTK